jgi:hypothetical protein
MRLLISQRAHRSFPDNTLQPVEDSVKAALMAPRIRDLSDQMPTRPPCCGWSL